MATNSSRNSFFIVILHLVFIVPVLVWASSALRKIVHVPIKMTWYEARRYCRQHHTDLATFMTSMESFRLNVPCSLDSHCWIGLSKNNTKEWIWSSGKEITFSLWEPLKSFQKDPTKNYCAARALLLWYSHSCLKKLEFLCYDLLVLVKLNKTWEGALEHCMALDKDPDSRNSFVEPRYDLANINFGGDTSEARRVALHAQTEEVWVGLRFLAGHWLWMNGAPLQEQLPVCPRPGSHCGAMSKTGQLLPEKDCEEKRNFLCATRKQKT